MMNKRKILAIDFVLIVGTLFALFFIIGYARPLVIAPIDGLETTDNTVLFSFENGDRILIDDNLGFSSPMIIDVQDNIVVTLEPGVYYWKIDGVIDSEVRELTIKSLVDLKLREKDGQYNVVNSGNTRLNVDIYEKGELTGSVVLERDQEKEVFGDKFIGGQDG